MTTGFRICCKCKQVKPSDSFYHRRDGQAFSRCKNCHNGKIKAYGGNMFGAAVVYGADYDATPYVRDANAASRISESILTFMSPADLNVWIAVNGQESHNDP